MSGIAHSIRRTITTITINFKHKQLSQALCPPNLSQITPAACPYDEACFPPLLLLRVSLMLGFAWRPLRRFFDRALTACDDVAESRAADRWSQDGKAGHNAH